MAAPDAEYLNRLVDLIRLYADEPTNNAKYSDDQIIQLIDAACFPLMTELNTVSESPIISRVNLTFTSGTDHYMLPPNVETILQIAEINDTYKTVKWVLEPRGYTSPRGPILNVEGRVLRLNPSWKWEDTTVQMSYIPNGDIRLHYGTAASPSTTGITLAASPTGGTLDTRENAYVGYVLRMVDGSAAGQERPITAYNSSTRAATVSPAFTTDPGTATYEVLPSYSHHIEDVLAIFVARRLKGIQRDTRGRAELDLEYKTALRALRLQQGRTDGMVGTRYEHDTDVRG